MKAESNTQAEKRKMNTYLKFGLIMLAFTVAGGILGFATAFMNISGIGAGMEGILHGIRSLMFPLLVIITVLSVIIGETTLRKNQALGKELEDAEDEEGDRIDYEMEKLSAFATVASNALSILAILVIATGYSIDYIEESSSDGNFLIAIGIFLLCSLYNGFWSVRFIKGIQKIYPERCGDPASGKFQEQWLKSCDEAEKEMIYQSAYKAYSITMKSVQFLVVAAMLCHLLWNTGIMAVLMLGIVWMIMTVVYCKNCVKKRENKVNT